MFDKKNGGVLINVHGYSENVPADYRAWEAVTFDRINKSLELAEFFKDHGIDADILISGGTEKAGVKEADAMYDWAKDRMPKINRFDILRETQAQNTAENILKVKEIAKKVDADAVFSVSSKDHMSRIVRDWAYSDAGKDMIFAGVPSGEPYSIKGYLNSPFIAEPPFWGYGAIEKIFNVDADKRNYVAKTIERFIEQNISKR